LSHTLATFTSPIRHVFIVGAMQAGAAAHQCFGAEIAGIAGPPPDTGAHIWKASAGGEGISRFPLPFRSKSV
jgi:hypothetical protein